MKGCCAFQGGPESNKLCTSLQILVPDSQQISRKSSRGVCPFFFSFNLLSCVCTDPPMRFHLDALKQPVGNFSGAQKHSVLTKALTFLQPVNLL